MMLENWGYILSESFTDIWAGTLAFVPKLIIAVIIFIFGWIIGSVVGKLVAHIFKAFKVDTALRSAGVDEVVKRGGYSLDSGKFVGTLVEWFIVVGFLVASFDVLGLTQVNAFLQDVVLSYLPRVIVAVLILLVSAVIADVMNRIVVASAKAASIRFANLLGSVTRWSIWIFAILTVMFQLGIAAPFVQTLFTGFIVAISLALGLSFGLGGQRAAAEFIDKLKQEVSDK
jgi:flagellar biosynthesis protein FliQ